jgi:hypothetical protein
LIFSAQLVIIPNMKEGSSHQPEGKKIRTLGKIVFAVGMSVITATTAGCSPKEQSRWNSDIKYKMGEIPADCRIVDGKPQIINANSESDGDFSLVYIRDNGDIVVKHWAKDPIKWWELKEAGEFYWTNPSNNLTTTPTLKSK